MDRDKGRNNNIEHFDKKWQDLFIHSKDIVARWGSNATLIYANDAFFTKLGTDRDRALGKSPADILSPQTASNAISSKISEAINTRQATDHHCQLAIGQSHIHLYFQFIPEVSADGTVFSVLSMGRDITDIKETEQFLKQNRALLAEAERIAHIGSWERNMRTGNLVWSEGLYRIYGLEPGTMTPSTQYFTDHIVHPADREKVTEYISNIYQGQVLSAEYRIITPEGTNRYIFATVKEYRNEQGDIEVIRGISKDITEQKLTEQHLLEVADFVRHIANASPDIIFIMTIDTKALIYANRQFTDILNYTVDQTERMRSTIFDIMHPDDIPMMMEHIENMRTAADGELRTIKYRLIDANGTIRWFIDRNAVFKRDAHNIPVEKIGISHEITDVVEKEQALKDLNKTLERKNKELRDLNSELTQFFYVAGHDLKEPLRKAYSFLEMILNKEAPNLTNAGRSFFRRAQAAIQRVNLVTDDIVAFSQVNSEIEKPGKVHLSVTLQRVLKTLENVINATKTTVTADALPSIEGYDHLLYLLFYHLVDNAIKFAQPYQSPHIQVKYTIVNGVDFQHQDIRADKPYIQLDFKDNGQGFSHEDGERIFKMFEKLEQKNKVKGSGIGLAICKKIVDMHYGHIFATGILGEGATITCILPFE